MALGTLATIALATSAAAGVNQAVEARRTAKDTERRLVEQQERARAEAGIQRTREDTGAEVQLGADDEADTRTTSAERRRRSRGRSGLSGVGGLTSSRVGL